MIELASRLEKLENYLDIRFNWQNLPREKKEMSPIAGKRSRSLSKAMRKVSPKYNYVVDMTERPQDPGAVNEIILERNHQMLMKNQRILQCPVTVGKFDDMMLNPKPAEMVEIDKFEGKTPEK